MKIDLHVHSKDGSDGKFSLDEIFAEAHKRKIDVISITDHDSIECQQRAMELAFEYGIDYLSGVELNISFSNPGYRDSKPASLDLLGYGFDIDNGVLLKKLEQLKAYRKKRAEQILERLNLELEKRKIPIFTRKDLKAIEETVDGAFGRPHIADYLIKKRIVSDKQEAFDKYLVRCNVPKMPVSLEEASSLIRDAGGKIFIAHPANPRGTSLASFTSSIKGQHRIIKEGMIAYLDGVECWHSSHSRQVTSSYLSFVRKEGLMASGGSDCHQQPVIMGTLPIPRFVAEQFGIKPKEGE